MSKRIVLPHYAHHVRERGVRKEPIFHDDSDRMVYIRALKKNCTECRIKIWAYCLMTNHVHLIAVTEDEKSISLALHDAHSTYSSYFNAKYGFAGHVWARRPDICAMDYTHMSNAVRYVERNPVRAKMVIRAEDYLWSSAAAHCEIRDDTLLSGDCPLVGLIPDWSDWLEVDHSEAEKRTIREHTSAGRIWCTPEVLQELERIHGRKLSSRKPGRPKKPEKPGLTGEFEFF